MYRSFPENGEGMECKDVEGGGGKLGGSGASLILRLGARG